MQKRNGLIEKYRDVRIALWFIVGYFILGFVISYEYYTRPILFNFIHKIIWADCGLLFTIIIIFADRYFRRKK
jgi:hypothetical protein